MDQRRGGRRASQGFAPNWIDYLFCFHRPLLPLLLLIRRPGELCSPRPVRRRYLHYKIHRSLSVRPSSARRWMHVTEWPQQLSTTMRLERRILCRTCLDYIDGCCSARAYFLFFAAAACWLSINWVIIVQYCTLLLLLHPPESVSLI